MKYSRSQLKAVKQALKAQIEKEMCETQEADSGLEDDPSVSLKEAKHIARALETDDEAQQKAENYNKKRLLRSEARSTKEVIVDWKVNIGDAVMFEIHGKTEFGMVVEKREGRANSRNRAMSRSGVKVMSSAGQYWVKPSSLTKLDD